MLTQKYNPTLTDLLKVDELPENLGFLQGPLSSFLDKLFYQNLQAFKSSNGDSASYTLDIITYKKLTLFEIPGTGVAFVVNPPDNLGVQNASQFNVSFEYNWEILKYVKNANIQSFSFDLNAYFILISNIFGITQEEFLEETINVFLGDINNPSPGQDPLQDFVTKYNGENSSQLTYTSGTTTFSDIYIQIQGFGNNIFDLIRTSYLNNAFDKFKQLIAKWIGPLDEQRLKDLLLPQFSASLNNISFGIEFPRNIFTPVDVADQEIPEPAQSMVKVNLGSFKYDTKDGFIFDKDLSFDFPKSKILGTGFMLSVDDLKVDLSRTRNIPEATSDGRPVDFIGVYIKEGIIDFPAEWFHNKPGSTGELYVNNLLAGTGGLSGTIGLRGKIVTPATPTTPAVREANPLIKVKLGNGFEISLNAFDITFHQNAIISSNIHGTLLIPGFKDAANTTQVVLINIDVHIGTDGEFNIVASTQQSVTAIHLKDVFDFHFKSLFIGRQSKEAGGRFYIGISGDIDFLLQNPIGKFLPDKVDIKKLLIYDDGKFEIEGGTIVLPKAFEFQLGPAKIGVTAISLGSYEKEGRKYKYFGFDGGVNVNPGGVDARGKGIKYYYTVDGDPFKWFIRLESLAIDIIIPGSAKKEDAAVIIKGFLSIKDPNLTGVTEPMLSVLKNSTEYAGGVYVSVPKFKGLEASAAMRLNPQVPSFIVDLGVEISTPILLGSTGLGIYGFRALFGKKYVATKEAANVPPDGEWWQYYKAKIDPDYKEGIQVSKFSIKDGFSFGAGVSLATTSDAGKTFSSKLFFMLSLPDVFLFQGQAAIMKDRIGLDAVPDPPFFAIIAVTKTSVEAGFGVNYKIPDEGSNMGKVLTVDGVIEMGFFFGNSASWYVNIGRDNPADRRIQARLFDILNMYSYLMISSSGIRAGAGVSYNLKKSFGPLSAELNAYIDAAGRISFRPKQIGGALQLGGNVSMKCCGLGFSVSGGATLSGESPHPKYITGEFEVCVKVLKKQRCAHFQFTWTGDTSLDYAQNPVLVDLPADQSSPLSLNDPKSKADAEKVAKAKHMVSGETFSLKVVDGATFNAAQNTNHEPTINPVTLLGNLNDDTYLVPIDSFIDLDFKKGMNVTTGTNVNKIGGLSSPCDFIEFTPPQRGPSERMRHEYYLDGIDILYYDTVSSSWKQYDFYNAMVPMFPTNGVLGTLVSQSALQNMKWAYWQQQKPNTNNKLRILANTPLSYTATMGNNLAVEDLGINASTLFCPGEPLPRTCIYFDRDVLYNTYTAGTTYIYKGVTFVITSHNGRVLPVSYNGVPYGLNIEPGDKIEIYFNEPMSCVHLLLKSGTPGLNISYYSRKRVKTREGAIPKYNYNLIKTESYLSADLTKEIEFESSENQYIDYVVIETRTCYEKPDAQHKITCIEKTEETAQTLNYLTKFLDTLIKNKQLAAASVQINPRFAATYQGVFMDTTLYPNTNWKDTVITLTQGYQSSTQLLFTISDNLGYSCNYSFELLKPVAGFNFNNIIKIVSIKPYPSGTVSGPNSTFLMQVYVLINGKETLVDMIGKSCNTVSYCYDECSTFLYEICYCKSSDNAINSTIPSMTTQQDNNNIMFESINKMLQPIWRPNTAYAIRIQTSDRVSSESGGGARSYPADLYYCFKTAGPIGHYHKFPVSSTTQAKRVDFANLEDKDHEGEFQLATLKHYIDYSKSYPNADGDLINAKPLFYKNVELKLFYLYNFVYEFYNDWIDYENPAHHGVNYIAKSRLEVEIKDPLSTDIPDSSINYTDDPANEIINLPSQFSGSNTIHATNTNGTPALHTANNDIGILNNLISGSSITGQDPCLPSPPPLKPIDIASQRVLNLRPLKLYTAQFAAYYNPRINGQFSNDDWKQIVHTYPFQTSRYANFEAQIRSYVFKTDREGNVIKSAVYKLWANSVDVPSTTIGAPSVPTIDLVSAQKVITNNIAAIDPALLQQYANQFDRLINGVFHINYNELQAPITTEFNIIRSKINNRILGILIRNPEPFNDPKLPKADPNISSTEPMETLLVSRWHTGFDPSTVEVTESARIIGREGWGAPSEFYVIHSNDRSKIFVTNRNFNFNILDGSLLKFTFKYKLYNGTEYADISSVDVQINLANYSNL
jgi:hypothetical protein